MSARNLCLEHLVTTTCDTVADVLDIYREHNAELPNTVRPRLLEEVKQLLATLQIFEQTLLQHDERRPGESGLTRNSVQDVMNDCGLMGKRLQLRITRNRFRDDAHTLREIAGLRNEVSQLMIGQSENESTSQIPPPAPDPPISHTSGRQCCCASTQDGPSTTRADQRSAGLAQEYGEAEESKPMIDSLMKEKEDLIRRMEMLESNDQAKLYHIKRLHAAVKSLGMRHPMRHRLNTWEELTDELPYIIEHIDSTNELLKDLEESARATKSEPSSPKKPQPLLGHLRISSEPSSPRLESPTRSTTQVALRPHSPTELNVSTSAKESASRPRKAHKSEKRRSGVVERRGFWNP